MQPTLTLKPNNFVYNFDEHFPKLTDPNKKVGVFLSGGMESSLISLIAAERYGKDQVIYFYSDSIFSSNDPARSSYIHTNIARAAKLLNITPTYLEFDYQAHITNRKESIDRKIAQIEKEYNVEFVLWGFTSLFFEVEPFKQDGMTMEKVKEIAFADPERFKSAIEEFHLETDKYTWHLLDIDIPAEVYPQLRDTAGFIKSPFKNLNKCEVVDLYRQLGWLDIVYQTSSCIRESLTKVGKHCGKCFNCQQRYDAFRILGDVPDLTEYAEHEIVTNRDLLEQVRNAIHP